jgi:acetylornithine deacetylase
VAIDSTNPDLGAGVGEAEIADFCRTWLAERGVDAWLQDTGVEGRPNVIGRVGGGAGPTLVLNAHLDTVGVGAMRGPFTPFVDDHGRLHGRGAVDTKGGLAALMVATSRLAAVDLPGTVLLTCVADEEWGSIGTEAAAAEFPADAAIVSEPTDLEVVVAHQGFAWIEIETIGRAAHGSRPDLGIDAITMMGPVLAGLSDLAATIARREGHPRLGPGSMHASLISGGQEASTYPPSCTVGIERRTIPGETGADALAEVETMLEGIASRDRDFVGGATLGFERPAYEIAADHPLTRLLVRHGESVLGLRVARRRRHPLGGDRPERGGSARRRRVGGPRIRGGSRRHRHGSRR